MVRPIDKQVGKLVPGQHFGAHLATLTIEVNFSGTIGSSTSMPDAIGESRRGRARDAKDSLILLNAT
jgi:hypothetical protein